jgi:hypothetical protein
VSDREIPPVPPGQAGRARDLSRRRSSKAALPDTGRRHHIGAPPPELTVLRADGTVGVTRTAAVQLADLTDAQVTRLAERIEAEMEQAAAALDFERAGHLRDEAAAARAELERRSRGRP